MEKVVISVCKEPSSELETLINTAYLQGEIGILPWDDDKNSRLKTNAEPIQVHVSRGEILVAYVGENLVGHRGVKTCSLAPQGRKSLPPLAL